ncbi:MAG: A/G-specific adenine glycosylase [Paludibacter sp.]|nr:A/G-specific adenine glycosylase [Paludibacter sp.]
MVQISNISGELIKWYEQNKRELPWRDTSDPYKIWISEIILQQTRVNQGLNYFIRFIERFPNIKSLADANEDEVLKYWQGLGYYTRARNLHKAAILIVKDYDGIFPTEYNKIVKLTGIGEYTAAAISSFAFNEPFAVLDGNVYRVISRLFGIETPIDTNFGKKEFARLAQSILSISKPAHHNQAIMEFGALQCIPSSPDCINCPLKFTCRAFELNKVSLLPVKSIKTKVSNRFFNYLFIKFQDSTYLQKRVAKDIWQNLYEFPLIESNHLFDLDELQGDENFKTLFKNIDEVKILKTINPMKHILSHRVIYAQFVIIKVSNENEILKQFIKTSMTEIDKYAISRLMELFIESELE